MEINSLFLNNLRNEEHYKFHLDFTKLVAQYTPATLGIELKYPGYLAAFNFEAQAINVMQGSVLTDGLSDFDYQRDFTTRGMVGTVNSAMNHFDLEVRQSANKLNRLLDSYGDIPTKPYDQETAAIIKLVEDLEGAYAADVTSLGIAGWVQELKAQNLAFDNLKNQRYDENSAKPQQNLKNARLETDSAYRDIVKHINALIVVNGDTAYAPFVLALNERIENYQRVLAVRQGRNAKDEGEAAPKK